MTYIVSPMRSVLSQYVVSRPRDLVAASQRANQRMQELALQALTFQRVFGKVCCCCCCCYTGDIGGFPERALCSPLNDTEDSVYTLIVLVIFRP